jgi:hypothetical protein
MGRGGEAGPERQCGKPGEDCSVHDFLYSGLRSVSRAQRSTSSVVRCRPGTVA